MGHSGRPVSAEGPNVVKRMRLTYPSYGPANADVNTLDLNNVGSDGGDTMGSSLPDPATVQSQEPGEADINEMLQQLAEIEKRLEASELEICS